MWHVHHHPLRVVVAFYATSVLVAGFVIYVVEAWQENCDAPLWLDDSQTSALGGVVRRPRLLEPGSSASTPRPLLASHVSGRACSRPLAPHRCRSSRTSSARARSCATTCTGCGSRARPCSRCARRRPLPVVPAPPPPVLASVASLHPFTRRSTPVALLCPLTRRSTPVVAPQVLYGDYIPTSHVARLMCYVSTFIGLLISASITAMFARAMNPSEFEAFAMQAGACRIRARHPKPPRAPRAASAAHLAPCVRSAAARREARAKGARAVGRHLLPAPYAAEGGRSPD